MNIATKVFAATLILVTSGCAHDAVKPDGGGLDKTPTNGETLNKIEPAKIDDRLLVKCKALPHVDVGTPEKIIAAKGKETSTYYKCASAHNKLVDYLLNVLKVLPVDTSKR